MYSQAAFGPPFFRRRGCISDADAPGIAPLAALLASLHDRARLRRSAAAGRGATRSCAPTRHCQRGLAGAGAPPQGRRSRRRALREHGRAAAGPSFAAGGLPRAESGATRRFVVEAELEAGATTASSRARRRRNCDAVELIGTEPTVPARGVILSRRMAHMLLKSIIARGAPSRCSPAPTRSSRLARTGGHDPARPTASSCTSRNAQMEL